MSYGTLRLDRRTLGYDPAGPLPSGPRPAILPAIRTVFGGNNGTTVSTTSNTGASPTVNSNQQVDTASVSSGGQTSTQVTVEPWGKGKNSSVEGILRNQGYSLQEIYAKDANGQTLIDRVASSNGLKNPNLIQPGQQLNIPSRGRDGADAMQPGDSQSAGIRNGNTTAGTSVRVAGDGTVLGKMRTQNGTNRNAGSNTEMSVSPGGRVDSGVAVSRDGTIVGGRMTGTSADGSARDTVRTRNDGSGIVSEYTTEAGRTRTTVNGGVVTRETNGNEGQGVTVRDGRTEREREGFLERTFGRGFDWITGHRERADVNGESIGGEIRRYQDPRTGETIVTETQNGQTRVVGSSAGDSDDGIGQRMARAADETIAGFGRAIGLG